MRWPTTTAAGRLAGGDPTEVRDNMARKAHWQAPNILAARRRDDKPIGGGARVGFTERPRRHSLPGVAEAIDRTASERSAASLEDLLRLTGASEATLRDELDPRSFSPAAQRLRQRRGG